MSLNILLGRIVVVSPFVLIFYMQYRLYKVCKSAEKDIKLEDKDTKC